MKKYQLDHKKELAVYNKQYRIDHKKEISEREKQYKLNYSERIAKGKKKRSERINKYIQDYKLSKGCSICGYNKCARALDFHHNGDKEFAISKVAGSMSLENIKKEMEKCVVICANCHRELHAWEE